MAPGGGGEPEPLSTLLPLAEELLGPAESTAGENRAYFHPEVNELYSHLDHTLLWLV